jgi:hypothetical protein
VREHDVGGDQSRTGSEQPPQNCGADGERRVGHDPERAARQPEVGHIGAHDRHRIVCEPLAQRVDPLGVELDGDDPRAGGDEGGGEGAGAGTDVDDEIARWDPGVSDDPVGPSG